MQQFLMTIWGGFVEFLHSIPFIHYGFELNTGIWLHLFGGVILAKIIHTRFSYWRTILIILIIATGWECIEWYIETPTQTEMLRVYGTVMQYWYDTAADIVGVIIIALITNVSLKQDNLLKKSDE